MNLFRRLTGRAKVMLGAAVAIAVVTLVVALPTTGHALLGGDRVTKEYTQGMSGFDHVQFDSFTNVPNIGDERNFFTATTNTTSGPFYDPLNDIRSGDTLLMRVYIHNNADSSLNDSGVGIARGTKVRVALPTNLGTDQPASAFISADNATPQIIEDSLTMKSTSPVQLQFVSGSAHIDSYSGSFSAPLSDDIIGNGVTIGSEALDGNFKGCFDHEASVTFKVKVVTPTYQLTKTVRKDGTATFADKTTVNAGDKVNFSLNFKNSGGTNLDHVVLSDRLPVGLTYVAGSTTWDSAYTSNQWQPVANDTLLNGGLDVGGYGPGGTVFVRFTAVVDDASKLQCGLNQIVNHGFAQAQGQGTIQASAEVDVTKTCVAPTPAPTPTPSTPSYSCDKLELDVDNASRTVKVRTFTTSASGGANFKTVDLDWGENGVKALNTNTPIGQPHTYAAASGNGPFVVTATAHFSTPNSNDVTATSAQCSQRVNFTSAATPAATVLPNTGAGNVLSVFAAATVAGALLHRLFVSRRLARR